MPSSALPGASGLTIDQAKGKREALMPEIKAVFFDQDGVIIDTERDGHRVAFNQTFADYGFGFEWDVDEYGRLLGISGGKERMRHYFKENKVVLQGDARKDDAFIKELHRHKTGLFVELIESGKLPLRAGVRRLMQEAKARGLIVGICTTSNERSANAVRNTMLADVDIDFLLAGDVVKNKKPRPDIYLLALKKTGLSPENCVVVEDSRNGLLAARGAGLPVVATTNIYTENEDLGDADIIVTGLGDPDGEKGELKASTKPFDYDGVLTVDQLVDYFEN
jgi:HAD superfamily hydrolase (TIGR01509 family)